MLNAARLALVSDEQAGSLSSRALRSGLWVGGSFFAQRLLQFISNLILTRLLFPEAFGLMALSTVFLVGLAMFSDLGIRPAIIRDPRGNNPKFLNTAWTIQVARGCALFAIGCLLAFPASLIYKEPILFPLLATLSTTAAISGFASVKTATAERDLDFRVVTFIQIGGQAISIIITIYLAYSFRSVWALAVGNIIGSVVTVLLGHAMLKGHRHRFVIDPDSARSLLHFGKWIFLSTVVTFLGGEGLRAIQAGFLSPAEFGVLAIAYTIAAIPIDLSIKLTTTIGLPAMSEAHRNNPKKISNALSKFRIRTIALSMLMVASVVFFSEFIINLLYDERYHAAGHLVVAIALSNSISVIFSGYTSTFLALGESRIYLMIMTYSMVARVLGLVSGFYLFDLMGMLVGIGVANASILIVVGAVAHKMHISAFKLDAVAFGFVTLLAAGSALVW